MPVYNVHWKRLLRNSLQLAQGSSSGSGSGSGVAFSQQAKPVENITPCCFLQTKMNIRIPTTLFPDEVGNVSTATVASSYVRHQASMDNN
jgi:hypothetical protein